MKNILLKKDQNGKIRNPNIDLIRIIGMIAIIIHHLFWHGKLYIKYYRFKEIHLLNILCMWHVSSFGIISGLVGRNSRHKFSNLFYLWIESIFYSIIFYIKFNEYQTSLFKKMLLYNILIVKNKRYWYITSYFGIYPFLPFINIAISNISVIEFKKCLYYMIGFFFIWSSFSEDCFVQLNGKSPFSLLIFYVIGGYMGKYIFRINTKKIHRVLILFICFLLFIMISLISYKINVFKENFKNSIQFKKLLSLRINSFPILMQVFLIILFVSQIQINKFLANVITTIAPLIFDIYLIHENPYIRNKFIMKSFYEISDNITFAYLIILIFK